MTLTVRPLDVDRAADQLGRGEVDAFIASPLISSQRVARVPLFSEGCLGMVARDHPRLGSAVPLGQLAAERHVTVFGPTGHDGPRRALEACGLLDRVVLEVTRFAALPYLVQDGELVAMVPRLVAEMFAAEHRVRLFELPLEVEPAQVSVYARHSHARSPARRRRGGLGGSLTSEFAVPQFQASSNGPREKRRRQPELLAHQRWRELDDRFGAAVQAVVEQRQPNRCTRGRLTPPAT